MEWMGELIVGQRIIIPLKPASKILPLGPRADV
jgi:hypothetical protein